MKEEPPSVRLADGRDIRLVDATREQLVEAIMVLREFVEPRAWYLNELALRMEQAAR